MTASQAFVCWEHVVPFNVNRQINETSGRVPEVFGGSRSWAREWLWGGTGDSPRQTSVTEVVTGWLSCEGGKIGRNNTFLVWREEKRGKRTRLLGCGQRSRMGGQDCCNPGVPVGDLWGGS